MPLDILKEGKDLLKITYCSDDWVDIEKLNQSELSVNEFVYFMTLMPGLIPRQEKSSLIKSIYEEFGFKAEPSFFFDTTDYVDGIHKIEWPELSDSSSVSFRGTIYAYKVASGLTTPKTVKPAVDFDAIAESISQFAKKHNLKNMLEFARYFAKENVTVGETRQIGDAIALGRYCRELELEKTTDDSCNFRKDSSRLGFQVKYDIKFGLTPFDEELYETMKFKDAWYGVEEDTEMFRKSSKSVAIFPMVGLGVVSEEMQNQLFEMVYRGSTPDLQKLSDGIDVIRRGFGFPDHISMVIKKFLTAKPIVLSFDMDMQIRQRPNEGKSPCEPNESRQFLPTLYNKWMCKQKCSQQAISNELRTQFNCTFVGAHAESLDVEVPCGCERTFTKRGYPNDESTVLCPFLKASQEAALQDQCALELETCQAQCEDLLPSCRTVETSMELTEPASVYGPYDDELAVFERTYGTFNKTQFADGEMLLHIDMNVQSAIEITEFLVTDELDLIIGLGGMAGFAMGFSVITVIHFVTHLLMTPYVLLKERNKTVDG